MVTRGFSSETFAYEAVAARKGDRRTYHVYYLGDFDRAGQDAASSLREKLERFADEEGIDLVFEQIAVTREQIADWNLPTREPKRKSAADRKWPHDFVCELDAIPPDQLRNLVETHINLHLSQDKLEVLKAAEESERDITRGWSGKSHKRGCDDAKRVPPRLGVNLAFLVKRARTGRIYTWMRCVALVDGKDGAYGVVIICPAAIDAAYRHAIDCVPASNGDAPILANSPPPGLACAAFLIPHPRGAHVRR